jgi:hypothetical protein
MPPTPKNEQLQASAQLVRTVEAALKIAVPDDTEIGFRDALIRTTADKLKDLNPNLVTRLYEAACDVKFPSASVTWFRKRLQQAIAKNLDLRGNPPPRQ